MNTRLHRTRLAPVFIVTLAVLGLAALGDPARAADRAADRAAAVAVAANAVADCDRLAAHPEDPQKVTPGLDAEKIDYPAATAACEAAVAAEPANMRARYQLARVLFYANQNERAVEQMRIAADAGYVQAQYIYATFIVRGRPYAPKDLCLADQYWRKAAAAGRQSARVQYVRYALRGSFANCPGAATWPQMRAMLDAAAKDAAGIYQQALVEDLGEALAARDPDAPREATCRCKP